MGTDIALGTETHRGETSCGEASCGTAERAGMWESGPEMDHVGDAMS
jgi:hypothetical protein